MAPDQLEELIQHLPEDIEADAPVRQAVEVQPACW
jgi:hypothetical protein